jgi:predicted ArsR family transcriptional regulator
VTYPASPGFKGDLDTGRAAAKAFAPKAKPLRVRTLEAIERGPATAEQVAEAIGAHWMVVRARCSELRAQGLIEDSGRRGEGALGGKVVVWRATTPLERAAFAPGREATQ